MYWNAFQYPSLAGRPRAQQKEIIGGAIREYGQAYRRRFLIVLIALIFGLVYVIPRISLGYPMSDWRFWIGPLGAGTLIRLYLLWETNGTIHEAVKKYVATRTL